MHTHIVQFVAMLLDEQGRFLMLVFARDPSLRDHAQYRTRALVLRIQVPGSDSGYLRTYRHILRT